MLNFLIFNPSLIPMVVDGLFIIISYAAIHLGFRRGLVGAAFGFFGWLLAFIFAVRLTPWGKGVIVSIIKTDLQINPLIAFIILMLIGWRIVQSISNATSSKVEGDHISTFNGLAGSGLYWLAFILSYSLVLRAADTYKMLPAQFTNGSRTYNQILTRYPDGAMRVLTYFIPYIADGWKVLDNAISEIGVSLDDARPISPETPNIQPTPPIVEPNAPPEPTTVEPEGNQPSLTPIFGNAPSENNRRFKDVE